MKLVGERRAIAALVLSFYGLFFLLNALMAPPEVQGMFAALAGVYGLAFFALVAGYFWARWYAIGLGLYGLITTGVALWQLGPEPIFLFFGATHAVVALGLWGDSVATLFDGRADWRARFHLDDNGVHRLGKAVIRIGVSLPYILLYALAPKGAATEALLALGALGLAGAGTWALLHLRTWGLFALTGAAGLLIADAADGVNAVTPAGYTPGATLAAAAAGVLLLAAVAPFARAIAARLRA
jgi:hypothetical protein